MTWYDFTRLLPQSQDPLKISAQSQIWAAPTFWPFVKLLGTHKKDPSGTGGFHWIATHFIMPTYSSFNSASHQEDPLPCTPQTIWSSHPLRGLLHFWWKLSFCMRALPLSKHLSVPHGLLHPLVWTKPSTVAKEMFLSPHQEGCDCWCEPDGETPDRIAK